VLLCGLLAAAPRDREFQRRGGQLQGLKLIQRAGPARAQL
jgi:hypothetical protein